MSGRYGWHYTWCPDHLIGSLTLSMQGARDESPSVDHEKAKREAQELFSAGEKQWGTDESKFNFIIGSRSIPQLKATFDEYTKVSSFL